MSRMCPEDNSERFGDNRTMCKVHMCPLVTAINEVPAPPTPGPEPVQVPDRAGVPGPDTGQRKAWSRDRCWHCDQEAVPGRTLCSNMACGRSLTPPALYIKFRAGEVKLSEGDRVKLGRLGDYQRVFGVYPNVSRDHAIVRVEEDGTAWVEPLTTPNGTFLNDVELQPRLSRQLASGDRIRLARNVEGSITLYER
jgi:hypothetical protein